MSQGPNEGDGPQRGGQPQGGQPQDGGNQPQQGGQPQTGQGYQQSGRAQQGHRQQPRGSSSGLDSNESAALSYILGWITGLIFFFIEDDDQYVRFHALQSILLSVVFIPVSFLLAIMFTVGGIAGLLPLFQFAAVALIAILMYKAYNGEWFQLPIIGSVAMDKSPPSHQPVGQQGNYQQGNPQQGQQPQNNYQQGGNQQGGQRQGEQPPDGQDDNR